MKLIQQFLAVLLAFQLGVGPLLAQPILSPPSPLQPQTGSGIANLRITNQSADGTEVLLTMDYTYDGFGGPVALIAPVIEKKDQKGVAAWFGADFVTIGAGRGIVSVKVKYFNDEPGVPPQFTSDRLRILILNKSGTAILSSIPFLKTIKWGSADVKPASTPPENASGGKAKSQTTPAPTPAAKQTASATQAADEQRLAAKAAEEQARQREAARQQAEAEQKRLTQEKLAAEEKAAAEARAREEARLKAEAESKRLAEAKRLAEERAAAEAKAREEARLKAEAATRKLAEEKRVAESRAAAEAKAREEARLKAEAEAKRLAREKAALEERAKAQAQAAEEARLRAEAQAREQARIKAEAEARKLAAEKKQAEERAAAEAKAREEARLRAEAETKRLKAEREIAEQKARAEAQAREEERLRAEAAAAKLAEDRRVAEAKAAAEAREREEARLKAEAETKRLADEKKAAEAARATVAATKIEPPVTKTMVASTQPSPMPPLATPAAESSAAESLPDESLADGLKSKVTSVDVVNRSLDRSQMTIGVEYEFKDNLGAKPLLGVDVSRSGDPKVRRYFSAGTYEIGKTRRNFALFPIKYTPPSQTEEYTNFSTDRLWVYLAEGGTAKRFNLFASTMLLRWRPPGSTSTARNETGNKVEIDDLKQTEASAGYVTVHYQLTSGTGKLRMRVFDSNLPGSAEWFEVPQKNVRAGRGSQTMDITVKEKAKSPGPRFKADTIEIELIDSTGQVAARLSRKLAMDWARPEQ